MSSPLRVFVVDDHELVRQGVVALLEAEPDIEVVGEAGTATQALARIEATRPDVAMLDVRLPDGNGIDVCREIRSRDQGTYCIILTAYDDDEAIDMAVLAGASDYVLKAIRGSSLVDKVRAVATGVSILDQSLRQRVIHRMREAQRADPRLDALTVREGEVLSLIAEGLTNREIAQRLALAEKTVKNYVSSLLEKLGLQHRTQAALLQVDVRSRVAGGDDR